MVALRTPGAGCHVTAFLPLFGTLVKTPGGGSGGAIYLDGTNDNALIAGTVTDSNSAREGGGAVFDVVDTGWGALTFKESHLHNDISGAFQTFPGVYYDIDGSDRVPVMIKSTDS